MGIGVSAAHLLIFIALVSTGGVLASTVLNNLSAHDQAQIEMIRRAREAVRESFELTFNEFVNGPKRVETEWTNDGSEELLLTELTILVDGVVTPSSSPDIVRFQVKEDASSNIWMPGETLELWVDVDADVDVGLVGPLGYQAYRRA